MLEAAQLQLKHGVTTVRDSYGVLPALVETRERIASPAFARMRGQAVGAHMLAAGNIVGWGGPYSVSFSLIREAGLTLFQEQRRTSATRRRKRTPLPPMGCGWPWRPAQSAGGQCYKSAAGSARSARSASSTKTSDSEFTQWRWPVGLGPSANTWPRWPSQRAHRISTRVMP